MKKKNLQSRLTLNKKTIAELQNKEKIKGGLNTNDGKCLTHIPFPQPGSCCIIIVP